MCKGEEIEPLGFSKSLLDATTMTYVLAALHSVVHYIFFTLFDNKGVTGR